MLHTTATGQSEVRRGAGLPTHTRPPLPEKPLVVIEPSKLWAALDLRELWKYHELLFFLIWRDIKIRYKQAVLGIAWVVLQPLLLTLIFTLFLGKVARVPSGGVPYALFVYTGLLPWTLFATAVNNSSASLVSNSQLITKVYFPRLLIPGAATAARLLDLAIALVILAGFMVYYRAAPSWNLLMLPLMIVLAVLLALGVGLLASALYVKYRDVGVILPVVVQLLMYVSPVLYPSALIPERWRGLYGLNPLVGIIDGFRASILGEAFNWAELAVAALITGCMLTFSAYVFRRVEKSFADVI